MTSATTPIESFVAGLTDYELAETINSWEKLNETLQKNPNDILNQRAREETTGNIEVAKTEWIRRREAEWSDGVR